MNINQAIQNLNDPQKEAVLHLGSPVLILAGPGSGKTRVITIKIAWLIQEHKIFPSKILAMTFTNKAAGEMRERVTQLTLANQQAPQEEQSQQRINKPFISTFHSWGAYILRRFNIEAGLKKDFQIYDAADQLALIKEANPNVKVQYLKAALSSISKAKDYGLTTNSSDTDLEEFIDNVEIYRNYEQLKTKTGNVDFGDLLLKPYQLLINNEEVFTKISNYWKWFFVDEYQDINTIQGLILHKLCNKTANVSVVGDDDQSIYRFRGAVLEHILKFEKDFPHTKVVRLNQNYRSTPQVISLANKLIEHNKSRHNKTIFSENQAGELPNVHYFQSEIEEEHFVVSCAEESQKALQELAIFYRVNSQSRGYEMALRRAGIPYVLVGATGFFERAEIRDAIAYLRLYRNPQDIVSFLRIANKPTRGLGKTSLEVISILMQQGLSWIDIYNHHSEKISRNAASGLHKLHNIFFQEDLLLEKQDKNKTLCIGDVLKSILQTSGLWDFYKEDQKSSIDRIDNLEEFISYSMGFNDDEQGWLEFLEQLSLNEGFTASQKQENNLIQLMTLHRSKGLEFDNVVICGLEEGLIPMMSELYDREELEEERRLLYVGVTRAKLHLHLTHCYSRNRYGRQENTTPSIFLKEIGNEVIQEYEDGAPISQKGKKGGSNWSIGDTVEHKQYGKGYVRNVRHHNNNTLIQVEFNSGYEAAFIPKFTQELIKK